MKFIVCPECQGHGSSSAYLGAFTSDDMEQMDEDFRGDYFAGNFDRPCDECQGKRVVKGCKTEGCSKPQAVIQSYWGGRHAYDNCWEHDEDARESAECEAIGAAERAFGA